PAAHPRRAHRRPEPCARHRRAAAPAARARPRGDLRALLQELARRRGGPARAAPAVPRAPRRGAERGRSRQPSHRLRRHAVRTLAIAGETLASLRSFALRLDEGPLAAAGLFVIAGPTGAGKSTLLDALCLALYDRTPRLGRNPRSILRQGAVSAMAAVEFVG